MTGLLCESFLSLCTRRLASQDCTCCFHYSVSRTPLALSTSTPQAASALSPGHLAWVLFFLFFFFFRLKCSWFTTCGRHKVGSSRLSLVHTCCCSYIDKSTLYCQTVMLRNLPAQVPGEWRTCQPQLEPGVQWHCLPWKPLSLPW